MSARIFRQSKPLLLATAVMVALLFYTISHHFHTGNRKLAESSHDLSKIPGTSLGHPDAITTSHSRPTYADGTYQRAQTLRGLVFTEDTQLGNRDGEFSTNITLSVVKSLSQSVTKHIKQIFDDEYNENMYYATIPAILKRGAASPRVEIIQRVWLAQYERMKTKYRRQGMEMKDMFMEWHNSWQENYFYHMITDENYNPVSAGNLLGIPTTTNIKFTYKSDGLMDPRLAQVGDRVYLVFHTWLVDKQSNNEVGGRVHIWDMDSHVKKKLNLHIPLQRTEINWIPLDINGELHFTYSIDPLRVMKCNPVDGDCHFVYEQDGSHKHPFVYTVDHLRGGTPWIKYSYPYYISLAHNVATTHKPYEDFTLYNANLVVINVESWRVVYISRSIKANIKWLKSVPIIRNHTIVEPFWYPTGIILQTDDIADISCHLNDDSGYILRLRGLKDLLTNVIRSDKLNGKATGPKVRVAQQYVLESVKETYKDKWTFKGDYVAHTIEGVDIPG